MRIRVAAAVGLSFLAASPAAAHEGWGVVSRHGFVYVADIPANVIWRIGSNGAEVVARGIHSHALAIGPGGAVYGTDVEPDGSGSGRVWRVDAEGRFEIVVPAGGANGMGLQSFLVGPDGAIYSASAFQADRAPGSRTLHLLRRRADGTIDTLAGGPVGWRDGAGAAARFSAIDGMAWLADGSLVVVDGARLRRVDLAGNVRTLTPPLSRQQWGEDLLGVAVGRGDTLIAADFAGRVLRRWHAGKALAPLDRRWYWAHAGVVSSEGMTFVLEHPRAPFGILGDLGVGPYLSVRAFGTGGPPWIVARLWGRNTDVAVAVLVCIVALMAVPLVRRRRRRRAARAAEGFAQPPTRAWL